MIAVFKNVGQKCTAKNYYPVSLLSMVSKVFVDRFVDQLEKCFFF